MRKLAIYVNTYASFKAIETGVILSNVEVFFMHFENSSIILLHQQNISGVPKSDTFFLTNIRAATHQITKIIPVSIALALFTA